MAGAVLAAFCLALPAGAGAATKSASDIAPIIGTWHDGGAVINVTGGGGSFQGTVVSGEFGACGKGGPGTVVWIGLSGSGFSYSGQIPFVHSDDCSSAGTGPATFTLSDINSGTWSAVSPDGMTYSSSFTREGTWPGADNGGGNKPKTNCKKNGKPVLCPQQKKTVKQVVKQAKKTVKLLKGIKPQTIGKRADDLGKVVALGKAAGDTQQNWLKEKLPKTPAASKKKFETDALGKAYLFLKHLTLFPVDVQKDAAAAYALPEGKALFEDVSNKLYQRSYSELNELEQDDVYFTSRDLLDPGDNLGVLVSRMHARARTTGNTNVSSTGQGGI